MKSYHVAFLFGLLAPIAVYADALYPYDVSPRGMNWNIAAGIVLLGLVGLIIGYVVWKKK